MAERISSNEVTDLADLFALIAPGMSVELTVKGQAPKTYTVESVREDRAEFTARTAGQRASRRVTAPYADKNWIIAYTPSWDSAQVTHLSFEF